MAPPRTMHGARLIIQLIDPETGESRQIGSATSISYSMNYSSESPHTLGRFSPAETIITAQEVIPITINGLRILGQGAHKQFKMSSLGALLEQPYIELQLFDRQTQQLEARMHSVKLTGFSSGAQARSLQDMSVSGTALLLDDESTVNAEHPSATDLPPAIP